MLTIGRESAREEVITDDDLKVLADLQADAWKAEKRAQRVAAQIETRIAHGATVTATKYHFDRELGMARSRKERAG